MRNVDVITDAVIASSDPRTSGEKFVPGLVVRYGGHELIQRSATTGDLVPLNKVSPTNLDKSSYWRDYLIGKVDPTHASAWEWRFTPMSEYLKRCGATVTNGTATAGLKSVTLTTTATNARSASIHCGTAAGTDWPLEVAAMSSDASTVSFGLVGRFKVTTTPDAQAKAYIALTDDMTTNYMRVGANGNLSDAYWSIDTAVASGDSTSTVAFDTSYHDFVVYRVGAVTYWEIDGVAIGSSAKIRVGANCGVVANVQNGTTAAAQTMVVAYWGLLTPAV